MTIGGERVILAGTGDTNRYPSMSFVTRVTLRSGDRVALDETVADIKEFAKRKGAELKGPHPRPPDEVRVPLSKHLGPGDRFRDWTYTVYTRDLEIVGHDAVAREVATWSFPRSVHVAVEVERVRSAGS